MDEEKKLPGKENEEGEEEEKQDTESALANAEGNNTEDKKEDKISPDDIELALEQLPPEVRRTVQSFMGISASYRSGPMQNPLFDKFTDEHIDTYLGMVKQDDLNDHHIRKTNRWFYLFYAVMAIGSFMAGVYYLLPLDRDLLVQLIVILVTIAGGLGAGYGLSKR